MDSNELRAIWESFERLQANQDANATLIIGMIGVFQDDPRLAPMLRRVIDAYTADRLNRAGVRDRFIDMYDEALRARMPDSLRDAVFGASPRD